MNKRLYYQRKFFVRLHIGSSRSAHFQCEGALINDRWIVTLDYCILDGGKSERKSERKFSKVGTKIFCRTFPYNFIRTETCMKFLLSTISHPWKRRWVEFFLKLKSNHSGVKQFIVSRFGKMILFCCCVSFDCAPKFWSFNMFIELFFVFHSLKHSKICAYSAHSLIS